jgi:hypothetical protein
MRTGTTLSADDLQVTAPVELTKAERIVARTMLERVLETHREDSEKYPGLMRRLLEEKGICWGQYDVFIEVLESTIEKLE